MQMKNWFQVLGAALLLASSVLRAGDMNFAWDDPNNPALMLGSYKLSFMPVVGNLQPAFEVAGPAMVAGTLTYQKSVTVPPGSWTAVCFALAPDGISSDPSNMISFTVAPTAVSGLRTTALMLPFSKTTKLTVVQPGIPPVFKSYYFPEAVWTLLFLYQQ